MPENYIELNDKTYMLDELSYFGLEKSDAMKRRAMWEKSGYEVRCIKSSSGKYIIYREYPVEMDSQKV